MSNLASVHDLAMALCELLGIDTKEQHLNGIRVEARLGPPTVCEVTLWSYPSLTEAPVSRTFSVVTAEEADK